MNTPSKVQILPKHLALHVSATSPSFSFSSEGTYSPDQFDSCPGLLGERELEYTERNDHNQAQPLRACITLMVYEPKLELFLSPRSGMTVGLTHVRGALKTGEVTVSIWRLNDIISELTGHNLKEG
jgi:hypothetical protein